MSARAPPLVNPDPDRSSTRVLVLGCGVNGLSSARVLQQKGFKVDIWAKDLPPNTTSNKAGAYWYPYTIFPEKKVHQWAKDTYIYYRDFLSKIPRAGVTRAPCVHFFDHPVTKEPFFKSYVPHVRKATKEEIPAGFVEGEVLETYSVDVDHCLEYMTADFLANGGRIVRRTVHSIQEAFAEFDIVVNCTGLGSRELFNDQTLYAGRGQTVVVRGNGHEAVVSTHTDSVAYIIPRGGDIVLGGTFQRGNESLLASESDTKGILERCSKLYPIFEKVDVIREKVGLRPCRPEVRLEPEVFGNKVVVHNYGHGGGGWTVHFGCALEVHDLVKAFVDKKSKL